jgi:hypothetical protein
MTSIIGPNWQLEIRDENQRLISDRIDLFSININYGNRGEFDFNGIYNGPVFGEITAQFEGNVDHIFPDFITTRKDELHLKRRDDTGHYAIFKDCTMSSINMIYEDYGDDQQIPLTEISWKFRPRNFENRSVGLASMLNEVKNHVIDWRKSGF